MQQKHREVAPLLEQLPRAGDEIIWVAALREDQYPLIGVPVVFDHQIDQEVAGDDQNPFHTVVVNIGFGPLGRAPAATVG